MADMMDDIAHLSHEIGPRPAGTEEEQQAALYIADELQKSAGFSTVVEDVSCASSGNSVRAICFTIAVVCTLLSIIFPVLAVPCVLLGLLTAALFACEVSGKSVLSRFLRNGVSQNVVAKYNPVSITSTNKRRKIILMAHYDSARVATEYQGIVGNYLPTIRLVTAITLVVAPLITLIKTVFFSAQPGGLGVVFTLLQVICLIILLLPLANVIKTRVSSYNEAANNDAAGIAVLLDVARTVGNGLVSAEAMEEAAYESGVEVHGEEAAREAGAVPEGVEIEYQAREHKLSPEESLAAAKAAIAAFTGQPVADKVPLSDISPRLVRHGELYDTPEDAAAAAVHFEVEDPQEQPAYVPPAYDVQDAAQEVVRERVIERIPENNMVEASEDAESFMRDGVEALQPGATGMGTSYQKKVPSWAKAAQEKAHANRPDQMEAKNISRSRFADAPAAQIADASRRRANAPAASYSAPAVEVVEQEEVVSPETATYQEPESELSKRLAALREEIDEAAAPLLKKKENISDVAEAEVSASTVEAVQETPIIAPHIEPVQVEEAPEPVAEQSSRRSSSKRSSRRSSQPKNNIGGFLGRASQMVNNVSSKVSEIKDGRGRNAEDQMEEPENIVLVETVHDDMDGQTTAMPQIDVSQFVTEEEPAYYDEPAEEHVETEEVFDQTDSDQPAFIEDADVADEAMIEEEYVEPVAPIVGMEEMTSVMPVVQQETIVTEEESQPDKHVIVLPDVVAPVAGNIENAKQRAPMAAGLESTQSQSQALLSNMLPQIDDPISAATTGASPAVGGAASAHGLNLPDFNTSDFERVSVSADATAENVPVQLGGAGNTGSFATVGEEIIEESVQDEVFVEDADDSVFDEGFTQTGAFAGPDYVEMPRSRVGRLFGRFGKKKKQQPEPSIREWVDVDSDYEARSVGKERGSWESFRNEEDDSQFVDVDYDAIQDDFPAPRGWNGGAFSLQSLRDRVTGAPSNQEVVEYDEDEFVVTPDVSAPMRAIPDDVKITEEINNEMRRLRDFRHPDIDTEVWFVALGAEEALNSGMKAFIEEHRDELKGAIIVNLEGVGAGTFSFIDEEGEYRPTKVSSRMKRILRQASERSGVPFATNKLLSRNTAAHVAAQHGLQAMTLAGMDGNQTAYYGSIDDAVSNIIPEVLEENSRFVLELLKSV